MLRRWFAFQFERLARWIRGDKSSKPDASFLFDIRHPFEPGKVVSFAAERVVGFRVVGRATAGDRLSLSVGESDAVNSGEFWEAWHACGGRFSGMEWVNPDGSREPATLDDFH